MDTVLTPKQKRVIEFIQNNNNEIYLPELESEFKSVLSVLANIRKRGWPVVYINRYKKPTLVTIDDQTINHSSQTL